MEEDLINFLLADAGVLAAVSTRVYWNVRPQSSALPAITLQRISDIPVGDDEGADDLTETRVQVDCWASTFAAALAAGRAVEAALSGKSFSHNGTQFQGAYIDGGGDTTEPTATQGSVIHRTRIDFEIWHREEN